MNLNRISVLAAPIAILILFGSALIGKDALAFRDVGHFYTPLYDYVAYRTSQSWLPLWNPLDATGMPLLGETTTAVLYPPRQWIFALPVSTDVAMSIYVVLHLILAACCATLAARWAGASRQAARIGGVIYPLSGSVLFLYTNPPFLVGASWLPLAVASLTATNSMSWVKRSVIAGPVLAMMVIGGDPQTALHTMLVAIAFWIVTRLSGSTKQISLTAILTSGLLAGILAAPQLAASITWSNQSERVVKEHNTQWLAPPEAHSRRNESYQFSLPPWHAAEILSPRVFGSLLPIHARISTLIPGDGRMWTPTIYLGAVTAWMILARLFFCGRRPIAGKAWLWLAAISLCLSLGHFGFVWVLQQFPGTLPHIDSAIGGPYWLLYEFLPGYDAFRYPAKWLPMFSLAISIALSLWIDERPILDEPTNRHSLVCYLVLLLLAVAILAVWRYRVRIDPSATIDEYWGPLNLSVATREIAFSVGHSLAAIFCIFAALRMRMKRERIIQILLLITTVDLSATAYINLSRVRRSDIQDIVTAVDPTIRNELRHRWMRTQSGDGWPVRWRQTHNPDRLTEVSASERISWFGRWHLRDRQAVFNNMVSIRSRAMSEFWLASNRATQSMNMDERERFWKSVRTWLAIDGVLHASNQMKHLRSNVGEFNLVDVTQRFETASATPFRFSTDWLICDSTASFDDFLRDVHENHGKPRHVVHPRSPLSIKPAHDVESKAIIEVGTSSWESTILRVHSESDGILVRSTYQDGSWKADLRKAGSQIWISTKVFPVDFLLQGIAIESGDWEIRFRYAPAWLTASIIVSTAGWLACLLYLLQISYRQWRGWTLIVRDSVDNVSCRDHLAR